MRHIHSAMNIAGRSARVIAMGICGAALLAGCATPITSLDPGKSTAQDVESRFGKPTDKVDVAGGGSTWFYPTGYYGFQTFAVRLDAAGTVQKVEQILTSANVDKVQVGKTSEEVLAILGPSRKKTRFPRTGVEAWDYRLVDVEPETLSVEFNPDGHVRQKAVMPDNYRDGGPDTGCTRC